MWLERLRPASFRGVPFYVDDESMVVGRRTALHEYPQRDTPWSEDLGRRARSWRVSAFLLGDDYFDARDALIEALESAGPGQLVLPRFGAMRVTLEGDCTLSESTREGGYCRIDATFVEAGEQSSPTVSTDTLGALTTQSASASAGCAEGFARQFSVAGYAGFVSDEAISRIDHLLAELPLGSLASLRADPGSPLYALLPEQLSDSVRSPGLLGAGLVALVRQQADVAAAMRYTTPPVVSGFTPSRVQANANAVALQSVVRQAATVVYVETISTAPADTLESAREVRGDVVASIDALLLADGIDQQLVEVLQDLQTAAVDHIGTLLPSLPQLVSITHHQAVPAVVAAHDFYGTSWWREGREQQLVSRNRQQHPGFISAGVALLYETEPV